MDRRTYSFENIPAATEVQISEKSERSVDSGQAGFSLSMEEEADHLPTGAGSRQGLCMNPEGCFGAWERHWDVSGSANSRCQKTLLKPDGTKKKRPVHVVKSPRTGPRGGVQTMPSGLGFFPSLCKRWLRFWHCPAPDNGLLVGSSTTKKQRLPPGGVPESWHGPGRDPSGS